MYRRLYPSEKCPDGHPELAVSLNNLGVLLDARGEYSKAELYYREALDVRNACPHPTSTRTATPNWRSALATWANC